MSRLQNGDVVTIVTPQGAYLVNTPQTTLYADKAPCLPLPDGYLFQVWKHQAQPDPVVHEGDLVLLKNLSSQAYAVLPGNGVGMNLVSFSATQPVAVNLITSSGMGSPSAFAFRGSQTGAPVYKDGSRAYGIVNTRARGYISACSGDGEVRTSGSFGPSEQFKLYNVRG